MHPAARNLLIWLLLFVCPQVAANAVSLEQPISLKPYMSYYEDVSGEMALADVLSPPVSDRFESLQGRALNSGLSKSVFWLRIDLDEVLTNTLSQIKATWLLELNTPFMNYLDVYYFQNAVNEPVRQWQTGDKVPFNNRPLSTVNFTFPMPLGSETPDFVIVRLENDGLVLADPVLWQTGPYMDITDLRAKLHGLFYGAMIIMALYNFIIFLSLRDSAYLYYVLSIVGITFFEACNRGDAFKYFWPDSPQIPNFLLSQSIFFSEIFTLLFIYKFLQLERFLKPWAQIIKLLLIICGAMMLITPFIANRYAVNIGSVLAMLISVIAIYIGVIRTLMGSRSARVFLMAWGILMVAIFMTALMRFIPIPVNVFTTNMISVGLALAVVVLSLALADRFNRIKMSAQETLEDALQKLENSNLIKDQFLSTISHELRTPMNGIEGALSLINKDELSEVDRLYLNTAVTSAKDMTGMIDALLRFNEMQAGSIVLKSEPFNPVTFFTGIALDIEERCRQKDIEFFSDVPGSGMVLKGDPEQIRLVLIQLADNAVKYTPHHGQVSLKVFQSVSGGWATLVMKVEDSGIGISDEVKKQIFQPFDSARGNENGSGGFGIGLTLCRYLVEKMGGTLTLKPNAEQGTVAEVVLHLPILAHEIKEEPEPTDMDLQHRVLVVEDNPVNQKVMQGILTKLGCQGFYAGNGKEALDVLQKEAVDLVFMDCQMPVMDGYEATQKIRNELGLRDLPIIAVTANAMSTDKEKCLRAGMNDYLAKPVQLAQIRKVLLRWNN